MEKDGITKRQVYETLSATLDLERASFIGHWRDLADFTMPRRLTLTVQDRNRGDKRNLKIINSTATLAARTLRSGMHAGCTSPARPWLKMLTTNTDLNEYKSVKVWLKKIQDIMLATFLRSNIYNSLPLFYGDQGIFGTGALSLLDDDRDVIRTSVMPLGSYGCAINDRGTVDTFTRWIPLTVRQIVRKFVDHNDLPSRRWNHVSATVKNLWDQNNLDTMVECVHVVTANADYDQYMLPAKYKKYASCYYERGAGGGEFLRESGFDNFPIMVGRWDTSGQDVFGTDCPGMVSLGDIKSLQTMEKRKAEAIEKMVRPPMTGPASLRNGKASILPGDITYLDQREVAQKFEPAYQIRMDISHLEKDMREHEMRIKRAYYEDLFLMLQQSETNRERVTAREIDEKHEEKMLMLGPTLERENDEVFDPMCSLTFEKLHNRNMLPPPPQEFLDEQRRNGVDLRVEYTSVMAQAQKMIGISGVERFMGFVGNVTAVDKTAMDNVDVDATIQSYGNMTGIDPHLVRDPDEVMAVRKQRANEMMEAKQQEQNMQQAQQAEVLSRADTGGTNLLTDMMGQGAA